MEDEQKDDSILSELVGFYSNDAHDDDVLYRALAEYEGARTPPPPPVPLAGKT